MKEKIVELKKQLSELENSYFKKYATSDEAENEKKTADYYLNVGKCSGVGESLEILDRVLGGKQVVEPKKVFRVADIRALIKSVDVDITFSKMVEVMNEMAHKAYTEEG